MFKASTYVKLKLSLLQGKINQGLTININAMTNNYDFKSIYSAKALFTAVLIIIFCLAVDSVKAQTFYRSVSASQLDIPTITNVESTKEIKSEGAYLIKDGQLDEIYNLKLTLPAYIFHSSIADKKITFEKTHVMVLPIMGMVHLIGTLDVDGVKSTTNFQLGFYINSDQSITFKGTKSIKLNDFFKELSSKEIKVDIDFVLKNNLAVLTAKY